MDGEINNAYVSDHVEGLDYGSLDDTLDIEFYRSKLVIDFSKENISDDGNDNHRPKHITKRVEFMTAQKSPDNFSRNSSSEERNEISWSQEHEVELHHIQDVLFDLSCFENFKLWSGQKVPKDRFIFRNIKESLHILYQFSNSLVIILLLEKTLH